jgi:hypothetical protein
MNSTTHESTGAHGQQGSQGHSMGMDTQNKMTQQQGGREYTDGKDKMSGQGSMMGGQSSMTGSHREGMVARTIEQQTAKLPSDVFLWAAMGSIATSAVLQFTGYKNQSRFVGQWVAPFLLFGVYNKLVKQLGSDKLDRMH